MSVLAVPAAVLAADAVPAKQLFGKQNLPSKQPTQSLGFYAKGCLAGGIAIPVDGPAWQVIHLSRNRRWGNPDMIALVERLARESRAEDGWNGLMIGDISQPRGGPMLSGHASHQIGLDADIWLTPMPSHTMSYDEREVVPEASVLRRDMMTVDSRKWSKAHERLIVRAASYPRVERVFMHPAIKKKMCDTLKGGDRALLSKMRPIYGHHYHFHIRMKCPAGSVNCEDQVDPGPDSGCGKQVTEWLNRVKPRPVAKPTKPTKIVKPKHLMMSALPNACALVLNAASVRSMAEAEFSGGSNPVQVPVTAYAAEDPVAKVIAASDDFSVFIPPMGSIPQPLVRPATQ
ncbi:penicillin-insensitive murein endopeptidase [Rhizobium sp. TH2]|uniref:penicillin-insensitive murein endopeptidase n=1 Tax=Rhizobium sp. TH2 TaxID=2775403 RepID=UPI002207B975|nr:penicillin-insensitive murein endopeptidase [Rhizobium sp. TH2]